MARQVPPGKGGERGAGMDSRGTTPAPRPPRTTRWCAPAVTFPESSGLVGARTNSADQRPPRQLQAALAGTGVRSLLPSTPHSGPPSPHPWQGLGLNRPSRRLQGALPHRLSENEDSSFGLRTGQHSLLSNFQNSLQRRLISKGGN